MGVVAVDTVGPNCGPQRRQAQSALEQSMRSDQFLQTIAQIGASIASAAAQYNAHPERQQQQLPPLELLRICLLSGGVFRHPHCSTHDVATAIIRGLTSAGPDAALQPVALEFAYDHDVFRTAWASLHPPGGPAPPAPPALQRQDSVLALQVKLENARQTLALFEGMGEEAGVRGMQAEVAALEAAIAARQGQADGSPVVVAPPPYSEPSPASAPPPYSEPSPASAPPPYEPAAAAPTAGDAVDAAMLQRQPVCTQPSWHQ